MYAHELRLGDVISARGSTANRHFGIIVGFQPQHGLTIVHNSSGQGLILDWALRFFQAGDVRLEKRAKAGQEHQIVQSVMAFIGTNTYLLNFNMDHFVSFVPTVPVITRQQHLAAVMATALYTRGQSYQQRSRQYYGNRFGRYGSRRRF